MRLRRLVSNERVRGVAALSSLRGMNAGFGTLLSKKRKSLLIGIVSLAFLILVIGSIVKYSQTVAAARAAGDSTLDGARGKIGRAQGESVYSEDKAGKTWQDADGLLAKLDVDTNERKQAVERLRSEASGLKEKLRRLITLATPTQLFALPSGIAA